METVNFECGHCGKLMAVSTAHLGAQVTCPHCQGTVRAPLSPARPTSAESEALSEAPRQEPAESIFAPGEAASDDIFGTAPAPRVELPQTRSVVEEAPAFAADSAAALSEKGREDDSLVPAMAAEAPRSWLDSDESPSEERPESLGSRDRDIADDDAEDSLVHRSAGAGPSRPRQTRSMLGPILLIFLIPYAVVCTGVIAWLLLSRSKADPFEFLKDPSPKEDGAPERLKHDAQLPPKLRTALNRPVTVGDVEVTPLKVERRHGDLVLHLRMRNLASDVVFTPLPRSFVDVRRHPTPYTFLDAGTTRFYGGDVSYGGERVAWSDGKLRPGQEMTVLLSTRVPKTFPSERTLLWRVQVRRGFVVVDGTPRSATAVIGVEFPGRLIEKAAGSS